MPRAAHPLPGRRDAPATGAQSGFTFVEVITALAIAGIATVACLQAFAYGAMELERLGYRRQALGLLDGEMEYWRARFQGADRSHPVVARESEAHRIVQLDPEANLLFMVDAEISPLRPDRDFRYQDVGVRVSYTKADIADTLVLQKRYYVR